MKKRRIPQKKSDFDQYLQNTCSYLLLLIDLITNWSRLGLTQLEMNKWEDFKNQWIALYPQYTNLDLKTSAIVKKINLLQNNATQFMMPLLDRIAANPATTVDDRYVFHISKRDKTPTPRGKIKTVPLFELTALGGGQFETRVRIKQDASRASMHPLADAYEIRYIISDTAPTSIKELTQYSVKKHALDILEVGEENSGKTIYYCIRWINISNPKNSGPYSSIRKTLIL